MKKINNFTEIEKLLYDEQINFEDNVSPYRFVQIKRVQGDDYFYYDCLFAFIVILNHHQVSKWKNHQLMTQEFPFCVSSSINDDNKPKFQKKEWDIAVENAENIAKFLKKQFSLKSLSSSVILDLISCIKNIELYFELQDLQFNSISNHNIKEKNTSQEKIVEKESFIIVENLVQTLHSPRLFKELNFGDKHANKVYLLLEKIFYNFGLLSKYKIEHVYEQVTNMDQYLVNHMKNIYLAQKFPMINIEEETVSILNKFNIYLTQEIDKYLEQCIDNQLVLIDSIHNQFKKVNQV